MRINTQVLSWRISLLLNDSQDSYVIARCVILRSAQVNGTAIFIQLRVVDSLNKF